MTAHVYGLPIDELAPLAVGGGAAWLVARLWATTLAARVLRPLRRDRAPTGRENRQEDERRVA